MLKLTEKEQEYCNDDIKTSKEIYAIANKKYRRLNMFVLWPIRIIIFPVMLLIRLVKWTYHID